MDEPEAMTEAQLQELLADEEVHEAYELMADCKKVYQREKLRAAIPLHHGRGARRAGWVFYRKIAAIFLAVAFLGGLSFAAYCVFSPRTNSPAQVTAPSLTGRAGGESPIRFSDIRLDSILIVSPVLRQIDTQLHHRLRVQRVVVAASSTISATMRTFAGNFPTILRARAFP